ncbi:MAG: hypothetical protein IJL87_01830 [Clostridia bacterium]|nr:hypothetical protein [Clostridia bacterium]
MKRVISCLLVFVLCVSILSSCKPDAKNSEKDDHSLDISFADAFRDSELSQGYVTSDTIAFYKVGKKQPQIDCVEIEKVISSVKNSGNLPRSKYYEQFMDKKMDMVLTAIDYCMANGYSRFVLPSTQVVGNDLTDNFFYLQECFHFNNSNRMIGQTRKSVVLEDGKTLNYVLVTIPSLEQFDMENYNKAIKKAREIVGSVPKGYSQAETATYLYSYITNNVRFYQDEYYESDWNLAYDALINNNTVCAGYAEALYLLYNLAGIDCIIINGYLDGGGSDDWHAWNIAQIDGKYYLFDSTWDEGRSPEEYKYFGLSQDAMQKLYPRNTTSAIEKAIPECSDILKPVLSAVYN